MCVKFGKNNISTRHEVSADMEEETSASAGSSDEEERPILKMNHSPSGRGRLTCLTRLVPPLSPRKTDSFLPSTGREGYPPPTFANANERDTGEHGETVLREEEEEETEERRIYSLLKSDEPGGQGRNANASFKTYHVTGPANSELALLIQGGNASCLVAVERIYG
ncbi:hypothetical protein K0M31_011631 [Melipona bicolor]|uniref:Uncharacterized protein n=1 Tax=Melipona bicolor TaxID=60889 RepID=A0AA40G9X5_9HYME|nr:hypothetical protein K0M31_011631 [Melipona bicolor]